MRVPVLFGALALAMAPALQAGEAELEPAQRLVRMSEAARTASYQGVLFYQGAESSESMRITHRFLDGVERERVQSIKGEPREIIKQDGRVICLLPKDRKVTLDRPTPQGLFPGLTAERVAQIGEVYEFDDLGTTHIAGRACRGIAITPKDQFRYGYEIWADQQTHVPLKVNLMGNDGQVLEQMVFTEIDYPASIPDSAFETSPAAAQAAAQAPAQPVRAASVPGQAGLHLSQLPPGFRVTMRDVRVLPRGAGTVEHLLVSDGLSAISIFSARKQHTAKSLRGSSQMGAVNAYGRMLGRMHVTVVGEAPPATVRLIGDNLQPSAEPAVAGESAQPAQARNP